MLGNRAGTPDPKDKVGALRCAVLGLPGPAAELAFLSELCLCMLVCCCTHSTSACSMWRVTSESPVTLCHQTMPQVPPVVLEWDDLNCHWTSKKKQKKEGKGKAAAAGSSDGSSGSKQILHNLTGVARPGRCVSQELLLPFGQLQAASAWTRQGAVSKSGVCWETVRPAASVLVFPCITAAAAAAGRVFTTLAGQSNSWPLA